MPGLTIATGASPSSATATAPDATPPNPGRSSSSSAQASSPSRPPVSPITPTREHAQLPGAGSATKSTTTQTPPQHPDFALGRPLFTHTTQTDQVAVTPPRAQPIDFDSNPDVLALRSAITILQLQKARATADIQSLSRAKEAALAHPAAFAADLDAGRVRMAGDPLLSPAKYDPLRDRVERKGRKGR
ncbi:hypothetical protein N0V88_004402 [Collariella sp. IMI 366227]|nr:hypothetical protein N0V88_004402 [Collariella sp. IMI 366227]